MYPGRIFDLLRASPLLHTPSSVQKPVPSLRRVVVSTDDHAIARHSQRAWRRGAIYSAGCIWLRTTLPNGTCSNTL